MSFVFKRATKESAKLRMAIAGPAGSGKTFTALTVAEFLAGDREPAVIDTENESASKYADRFAFATVSLSAGTGFSPEKYIEAIEAAESAGFPVIVIDSLSHEWAGKGGILELVDQTAARMNGNKFQAWGVVTPRHDKLVRKILECRAHVIVTLRAKMEYVQERNERGKTEVRAVGMKPIQRDEMEYEFDIFGLLDQDNNLVIRKSRCPELSGEVIHRPGREMAATLTRWLQGGTAEPNEPKPKGGRQRPRVDAVKESTTAPDPLQAVNAPSGPRMMVDDMPLGEDEDALDDPAPSNLSMMDPEWRPDDEPEEPEEKEEPHVHGEGHRFDCSEIACPTTIAMGDVFVFQGRQMRGEYVLRRAEEEVGYPLCPKHVAAWVKGEHLEMKPAVVAAAS